MVSPRASVVAPTCFAGVCDGPCIVQLNLQLGQRARPGSISCAEGLPLPLIAAVRVACKTPRRLLVQPLCAMCRKVSCWASIQARPALEAAATVTNTSTCHQLKPCCCPRVLCSVLLCNHHVAL